MNKSIDVFAATNPAFLSLVLLSFIEGYNEEAGAGLPFPLAILPIPIVLSGDLDPTFDGTNIRTGFYSWVKQNPGIVVNLNNRINDSIEYIQPAISYGVARKIIKIDDKGSLWGLSQNTANIYGSSKLGPFFKKSKRLGNWIGQIKSTKTVFNLLGLEV
ncbi:three component ABC system middle component [Pedobacter sp. SYSU D00535]|uniref:three component ABC system middle component n=1 Tax=Pedobacter sp. SYSU D00535 TaxID=2810308 RepID=UPI001A961C01|nr:three component ABC system middle component [Pedobacter sp. SYSU D00535]